jgi:fermentation-respiration switch protein FrsA (DUF1100 family)
MADALAEEPLRARAPAWRFARNVFLLLCAAIVILYVAAVILLFAYQRDILFAGAGEPADRLPAGTIYRADTVRERDGQRLTIWRAAPSRAGAGTLVFFYGNGGSLPDFTGIGAVFHREGMGIVLASYRGYSGNGGSPGEAGLMADARAVLATIPKADGPIVLWGQSLGTGVAARMAAEHRGTGLILQSPYTAIVDIAAHQYPFFPVRWLMRDPFNTASLVTRIRMPVLILHGTRDPVVPFAMGEELARRFGPQARLVPVIGGGHDLYGHVLVPVADAWLKMHAQAIGLK